MEITMQEIISAKRDGHALTDLQIHWFIKQLVADKIPDYQTAALLMALYLRDMDERELTTLTLAMAQSGEQIDLSRFGNRTADKHSTGGVGDKTTLLAAPIAAAAGAVVAKMSGRGLGHTGGTIDKLESIPGLRTQMDRNAFLNLAAQHGMVLAGQSGNLAPADKLLYALRDVTATVGSLPLIASSILSKKLAAGSKNIVLDIKVGNGAFMKTPEQARQLAEIMLQIGTACGRNVTAVLTDMNVPLGTHIGNSLEIIEAAALLRGAPGGADLLEVSLALATEMLMLALSLEQDAAAALAREALDSGAAFEKLCEMVTAQGGDASYLRNPGLFPSAACTLEVTSAHSGYITATDTEQIGLCAVQLGAGRRTKEDDIDHAAGIVLLKKPGQAVAENEPIARLYANNRERLQLANELFLSAVTIEKNPCAEPRHILGVLRRNGHTTH